MKVLIMILLISIVCVSCEKESKISINPPVNVNTERIVQINQYLNDKDKDILDAFVMRKTWKMTFSEDGYYYEILSQGTGSKLLPLEQVNYLYRVFTLDGTLCYNSDVSGPRSFILDKSEEIRGMHLACNLLKRGARARFIFPPVLAYGLMGDFNKVPARTCLVYYVTIL